MALAVCALAIASASAASPVSAMAANYTWCEPGPILGCFEGKCCTSVCLHTHHHPQQLWHANASASVECACCRDHHQPLCVLSLPSARNRHQQTWHDVCVVDTICFFGSRSLSRTSHARGPRPPVLARSSAFAQAHSSNNCDCTS